MVTQAGREGLAAEAIACLGRQAYPAVALVAACDAEDPHVAAALRAACDRQGVAARVLAAAGRRPLGALRNLAVAEAAAWAGPGGAVVQWDDDDLYAPGRLAAQLDPIAGGAVGSCLVEQLYYFPAEQIVFWVDWRNRAPRSCLIPGTFAAAAAAAARARCPEAGPEARRGEDGAFLQGLAAQGPVAGVAGAGLYLRRFHGRNTWGRGHFAGNARRLGLTRAELAVDGRPHALAAAFAAGGYAPAGSAVRAWGRDGPAFTFRVPD